MIIGRRGNTGKVPQVGLPFVHTTIVSSAFSDCSSGQGRYRCSRFSIVRFVLSIVPGLRAFKGALPCAICYKMANSPIITAASVKQQYARSTLNEPTTVNELDAAVLHRLEGFGERSSWFTAASAFLCEPAQRLVLLIALSAALRPFPAIPLCPNEWLRL